MQTAFWGRPRKRGFGRSLQKLHSLTSHSSRNVVFGDDPANAPNLLVRGERSHSERSRVHRGIILVLVILLERWKRSDFGLHRKDHRGREERFPLDLHKGAMLGPAHELPAPRREKERGREPLQNRLLLERAAISLTIQKELVEEAQIEVVDGTHLQATHLQPRPRLHAEGAAHHPLEVVKPLAGGVDHRRQILAGVRTFPGGAHLFIPKGAQIELSRTTIFDSALLPC
ncbi:MAG: hypothetical protein [Cressdnaviricota sp.]|nr:MAG: hypothetical protein [Cressdnaviricota sp.]